MKEYIDDYPPVGTSLFESKMVDGEVLVRGTNMRCYWRDEERTSEVLDDDHWLRTGDLGYNEHFLRLTGRKKEVINRGGALLYPALIEETWRQVGVEAVAYAAKDLRLGDVVGLASDDLSNWVDTSDDVPFMMRPSAGVIGKMPRTSTGKPQRLKIDRYGVAYTGDGLRYEYLLEYSNDGVGPVYGAGGPAYEALDLLRDNWEALDNGTVTGEYLMRQNKGLWYRLMTEWPMNDYARMVAEAVRMFPDLKEASVLEVGSGVGNVSRLLAGDLGDYYMRTDINPRLYKGPDLPGCDMVYDFNEPQGGEWDLIFGCNALHCAVNPCLSVQYLMEALTPGGVLILGEGHPDTNRARTPWALNEMFGMFETWREYGGFRHRAHWMEYMILGDASHVGYGVLRQGEHDLGGIVWARK